MVNGNQRSQGRGSGNRRLASMLVALGAACAFVTPVAAQEIELPPEDEASEPVDAADVDDGSAEAVPTDADADDAESASDSMSEPSLSSEVGEARSTSGRLWLRFTGQFLGTSDTDSQTVLLDGSERVADPTTDRLEPSMGGHIGFDVPAGTPHFHIGAMVGAVSWQSETANDLRLGRSTWLDFDLTLRGQVEFAEGLIDLYLMVPAGLTVNVFSERTAEIEDVAWGHGPGFNVGALLGLAVDLGGDGVFIDTGWTMRRFFHDSEGTLFGEAVTFERDATTHQWHVGAGFFFDL